MTADDNHVMLNNGSDVLHLCIVDITTGMPKGDFTRHTNQQQCSPSCEYQSCSSSWRFSGCLGSMCAHTHTHVNTYTHTGKLGWREVLLKIGCLIVKVVIRAKTQKIITSFQPETASGMALTQSTSRFSTWKWQTIEEHISEVSRIKYYTAYRYSMVSAVYMTMSTTTQCQR